MVGKTLAIMFTVVYVLLTIAIPLTLYAVAVTFKKAFYVLYRVTRYLTYRVDCMGHWVIGKTKCQELIKWARDMKV